jgi:hypothetical protein
MRVRISGSPDLPFVLTHPPALLVELNCWSPEIDRGPGACCEGLFKNLSPAPVSKTSAPQCNVPTGGPPTCNSFVLAFGSAAWRWDGHIKLIFCIKNRDSTVSVVTRLQAGKRRNRFSVSGWGNRVLFPPKVPERPWPRPGSYSVGTPPVPGTALAVCKGEHLHLR